MARNGTNTARTARHKSTQPLDGFDIDDEYEPQEIVMRNKFYLLKSDIVLAEMQHKEPSIGTIERL